MKPSHFTHPSFFFWFCYGGSETWMCVCMHARSFEVVITLPRSPIGSLPWSFTTASPGSSRRWRSGVGEGEVEGECSHRHWWSWSAFFRNPFICCVSNVTTLQDRIPVPRLCCACAHKSRRRFSNVRAPCRNASSANGDQVLPTVKFLNSGFKKTNWRLVKCRRWARTLTHTYARARTQFQNLWKARFLEAKWFVSHDVHARARLCEGK